MAILPTGVAPEFVLFVALVAGTPGPLNLTLLAAGLSGRGRFGAGMVAGAAAAYGMLFALASAAARRIAALDPRLFEALQLVAAGLLLWLAWKMVRARPKGAGAEAGPRGARAGAASGFGIVAAGSKSISSAISAGTIFCDGRLTAAEHAVAFGTTAFACILLLCSPWLLGGLLLGRNVRSPRVLRGINVGGAACLAGLAGLMVI